MRGGGGIEHHGGLAALLAACAVGLALLTPSCGTTVSENVEEKAQRFLADTEMSQQDRDKTARDLARLCEEGVIKGC
jgi:hypothetical protein